MMKTNAQSALDHVAGNAWYVRHRPDSPVLEFIPIQAGDGHVLSAEDSEQIGEIGFTLPLHPALLCAHKRVNYDKPIGYGIKCPDCGDYVAGDYR